MDFNLTEYEKLIYVVSKSTLELTFRDLSFAAF